MTPTDLSTYGGPKVNAKPIKDETSQVDATEFNKLLEHVAQMTRTSDKARFDFLTVASGSTTVATVRTQWGTGAAFKPTVTRTGVGTYTATFSASYSDGLGTSETLALWEASGQVASGAVFGVVQCTASANVVTIYTFDSTHGLADLTAGTKITVRAS